MAKLFLVRHGKSAWNELGLWTGHTDIDLNEIGIEEARRAGQALRGEVIHHAHVSPLRRTHQTLDEIKRVLELNELDTAIHHAIIERHYGVHTGKNKWQVRDEVGEEEFKKLRRGWDIAIPEGETLKDVYARVVPYFEEHIKSALLQLRNVLVVAHGNSLRALVKHIENIHEDAIADVELGTGEVHCYVFDETGAMTGKEVRASNENIGKI